MHKIIAIFLALYFFLGTLFLPNGNLMSLCDLPKMYHNCLITEDKDMTLFDFFTDHVLNLDCIFDSHEYDDSGEKPHKPFQTTQNQNNFSLFFADSSPKIIKTKSISYFVNPLDRIQMQTQFYFNNYLSSIFRPPIA